MTCFGLDNIGNTCYFNTAIQVLLSCTHIQKFVTGIGKCENAVENLCLRALTDGGIVRTTDAVKEFVTKCPRFVKYKQHDAHDALMHILEHSLPGALKYTNMELTSNVVCSTCKNNTTTTEKTVLVDLGIERNAFVDAFVKRFSDECITGYTCDNCKTSSDATIKCSITHVPEILCIQTYSRAIPYSFALRRARYNLVSCIAHIGSSNGGHYIAYVKCGDSWTQRDDNTCTSIDSSAIKNVCMAVFERENLV